jgi:hypothetical protein
MASDAAVSRGVSEWTVGLGTGGLSRGIKALDTSFVVSSSIWFDISILGSMNVFKFVVAKYKLLEFRVPKIEDSLPILPRKSNRNPG